MPLTIQVTPEIERQLRQVASAVGLSPDTYVMQLIEANLDLAQPSGHAENRLSKEESQLLQTINRSMSGIDWQQYNGLVEKRQEATLTAAEHAHSIAFSDEIEAANANRLEAIVALAKLRHTSIDVVMDELELRPQPYG